MKYLRIFKKQSDYIGYINSDEMVTPHIALVEEVRYAYLKPLEKPVFKNGIGYTYIGYNFVVGGGKANNNKIPGGVGTGKIGRNFMILGGPNREPDILGLGDMKIGTTFIVAPIRYPEED
jgi:hypothetical protein